jgi:hypothetical protein
MTADSPVLSSSVLLLNRLYMALRVVSAKRAMTLVYRQLAEVVAVEDGQYLSYDFDDWVEVSEAKAAFEPHEHDWIRTVRFQIAVPKIIRLLVYDKLPRVAVKLNRRNLFARDQNHCQYCGGHFSTRELSLHALQREEGRADAGAGPHAFGGQAGAAASFAGADDQAVRFTLRELEAIP